MPRASWSTGPARRVMHGTTLLIGYGNPGRGDDGLGPAFARRIAARGLPGVTVEIDYQLTVDHALMIAARGDAWSSPMPRSMPKHRSTSGPWTRSVARIAGQPHA